MQETLEWDVGRLALDGRVVDGFVSVVDYLLALFGRVATSAACVAKVSAPFFKFGVGFRNSLKRTFQKVFGIDGNYRLDAGWRGGPLLQESNELGTAPRTLLLEDDTIGKRVRPGFHYAAWRG
jgi:hypothetical protein